MTLTLHHTPQPFPWGCQYYALYALVGDPRILADVSECSTGRFRLHMEALGYYLHPLWLDQTDTYPTPAAWWGGVFNPAAITPDVASAPVVPLLLSVPSPGFAGEVRTVGASVSCTPGLPVVVFDTARPAPLAFATLADFVASPYGQCYQVQEVGPARGLDFFTSVFGPGLPHVRPTARLAWEATRRPQ